MTASERVARGAALLDQKKPGWARLIDIDTLDVEDVDFCPCAQLSGTVKFYQDGAEDILGIDITQKKDQEFMSDHGFNCLIDLSSKGEGDQDFMQLNEAWRIEVSKRLAV